MRWVFISGFSSILRVKQIYVSKGSWPFSHSISTLGPPPISQEPDRIIKICQSIQIMAEPGYIIAKEDFI